MAKITIDLETCDIIVPKTFFEKVAKENEIIKNAGGTPIEVKDRIMNAVNTALKDTDAHLKTKK